MRVTAAQVIKVGVLDEPFIVPCMPAGVHHPRKTAFDDPTTWEYDEAGCVLGTADGLDRQIEVLFRPVDELFGVRNTY